MNPYDALTSIPRPQPAEITDYRFRTETPLSLLISSGAYRSVNAIGRWVNRLNATRRH